MDPVLCKNRNQNLALCFLSLQSDGVKLTDLFGSAGLRSSAICLVSQRQFSTRLRKCNGSLYAHVAIDPNFGHGADSHIPFDTPLENLVQQRLEIVIIVEIPREKVRRDSWLSGVVYVGEGADSGRGEVEGRRWSREEGEGVGMRDCVDRMVIQSSVRRRFERDTSDAAAGEPAHCSG